jgi:hypothetical protein
MEQLKGRIAQLQNRGQLAREKAQDFEAERLQKNAASLLAESRR